MDGQMLTVAALIAVTIGLWATGKLPEYLTALMFFAAAMVLAVAPASVIFSGFASAAFWLVISGYVIGVAIAKTGLAARAARLLTSRFANSYPRMVFGTVGLTYAFAFVMPSNMGRIALLMPIILALAERVGFGEGRAGRNGLALAVAFAAFQLSASAACERAEPGHGRRDRNHLRPASVLRSLSSVACAGSRHSQGYCPVCVHPGVVPGSAGSLRRD